MSRVPFVITTAPSIEEFTPFGGAPGVDVVINGSNLGKTTAVKFGAVTSPKFSIVAATQIHATVPVVTTNAPITIVSPDGTGVSALPFRATKGPILVGVDPGIGAPNTSVTLDGLNFSGVTSVMFNKVAAAFSINAATQIRVTVPPSATNGPITVTSAGGSDTTPFPFLVRTGKPAILGFEPSAGAPRTTVTIAGLDLSRTTAVRFNGVSALSFAVLSDTQISAVAPDAGASGPISVTTPPARPPAQTRSFSPPDCRASRH